MNRMSSIYIGILFFSFTLMSHAQNSETKKEIPSEKFYSSALKDKERIATFDEVAKWLKEGSAVLLDLRSEREFKRSHIKNAVNLPATELTDEALSHVLPTKNTRAVIYCENTLRGEIRQIPLTRLAYPTIKQLGYDNVFVLEEYFHNEKAFLLPMESEKDKIK